MKENDIALSPLAPHSIYIQNNIFKKETLWKDLTLGKF